MSSPSHCGPNRIFRIHCPPFSSSGAAGRNIEFLVSRCLPWSINRFSFLSLVIYDKWFFEGPLPAIIRQTSFDATWSEMAWSKIVTIDWDQLTSEDTVSPVCVDTKICVAFGLSRNVLYLDNALPPISVDVELYVQEYHESSPGRSTTIVNPSPTVEFPGSASAASSQLVVSSTVQPFCLLRYPLRLILYLILQVILIFFVLLFTL